MQPSSFCRKKTVPAKTSISCSPSCRPASTSRTLRLCFIDTGNLARKRLPARRRPRPESERGRNPENHQKLSHLRRSVSEEKASARNPVCHSVIRRDPFVVPRHLCECQQRRSC